MPSIPSERNQQHNLETHKENQELSHQLQAYVAWVNSQLKKKPAVKPVQDLRRDLRDGVVLASLVEIVAGEKLSGVQVSPTSQQEMKENVEKVLQFVASKKIRMHQTSAKGRRPFCYTEPSNTIVFLDLVAAGGVTLLIPQG
ncbi:dixin-like [Heteronotia binoei]|uniref:dixin-like n=1 Tax=Heteronotia binoei TaxID=13085 RepID=UPI0029310186|nr:dixin-like [Heteronotia binoei]